MPVKPFFAKGNGVVCALMKGWQSILSLYCNMADTHTAQQRRFNMQQIKSTNSKPEMLVRKFLFGHEYRYKLHDKLL